jgi:hypothetical protein
VDGRVKRGHDVLKGRRLKQTQKKTSSPAGSGNAIAKARRSKSLFASFSSEKEGLFVVSGPVC